MAGRLAWIVTASLLVPASAMASGSPKALDFLARVRANDCGASAAASARRFVVGDEVLGRVLPQAAAVLARFPERFDVDAAAVTLRDEPDWRGPGLVAARSAAVAAVLDELRADGSVPMLAGWRDEAFAIRPSFYSPARVVVERAAGPLFGVPAYGCFANGYVCDGGDGTRPTHLWLGRRADDKPTWPGLLDCLAAGGLAAGESPTKGMAKECAEEAGVPADVAARLTSVGGVSYTGFNPDGWGIKSDVLFNFDLPLEPAFRPACVDGEVAEFKLMPVADVAELLASPEPLFKPNVGVVLIDFMVRHGFVDPDEEGYIELMGALRSGVALSGAGRPEGSSVIPN